MPTLSLTIKHAGKTYPISANTDLPASAFKQAIYEATGVPPDRMKVMVKGGILKDDHDWSKTGLKDGGSVMVIGAAGPLPQAPEKATVFLEDMDDADLANALAIPVGLKNLGNTCYMNATVQALRGIPELQTALSAATSTGPASVPGTLRDLYSDMGRTTDAVIPLSFLQALRGFAPQFAEVDRSRAGKSLGTGSGPSAGLSGAAAMLGIGGGYAQQDAEECWTAIQSALKDVPGLKQAGEERPSANFIDQYMGVEIRRELKCDEAPEEEPSIALEKSLKIECNITKDTNFMASGISASLDQKVEKRSATLGRDAVYTQTSRVSRLPSYLTVHMVRFYWRQDISKKAKIMRKVKFPTSYDATDICTPELREQLLPVSRRLSELDRDRFERRKVRKRTKAAAAAAAATAGNVAAPSTATSSTTAPSGDVEMTSADGAEDAKDGAITNAGEALEDEEVYRKKEREELEKLVSPALKRDTGCSPTGLYELVAIVTHKGAAADAGHYIGFVKKSVFHPGSDADDVGEDWYKFDDDKVSIFPAEKLATLDGGGEDASAYVLLYRTKELA